LEFSPSILAAILSKNEALYKRAWQLLARWMNKSQSLFIGPSESVRSELLTMLAQFRNSSREDIVAQRAIFQLLEFMLKE